MNSRLLVKLSTITAIVILFSGCASTMLSGEKTLEEKFNEVSITKEAAEVLNTETDEVVIREKLVCGNEAKLGTRVKTKICRTQAEVDAMRENGKRELLDARRRNGR